MATKPKRATTGTRTGARRSQATTATTKRRGTSQKRTNNGPSASHMIENLEDGFIGELADMLHAERELGKVLPKLAQAASSRRLREALEWQQEHADEKVERLEEVFQLFDRRPQAEVCEGMEGILTECREQIQKTGPGPVRDAMIIAATQKAGHYAIAAYGTLCSWAEQLGEEDAQRLLEDTLAEVKGADRAMTRIAEQLSNPQADRGRGRAYDEERRPPSRGRNWQGSPEREWRRRSDEY